MTVLTLPIPRNETDFEDLVLDYAWYELQPEAAQPYGRRGAGQNGIDHQLRLVDGSWFGIQCKRYWDKKLTAKILQKDLDAAHTIAPPLARYIVATTKRADTKLQDWARNATINSRATVDIWFWDDVERWLNANPARLSQYNPLPAIVHAQGLLQQVGGTKNAHEVVAFAASPATIPGNDSDPESVKAASVLLLAGRPQQAFDRLAADRDALSSVASVWRVSASALNMLGDHKELLALAKRAATLGVQDIRLRALEATAHRALGDVARSRSDLEELLRSAIVGEERAAVLNQWLNLRLEEDHITYDALVEDVTPADRADPNLHLPLAQAALFSGNTIAFDEHVAVLEAAPDKVGDWIPQMLRAMAPIVEGERRGIREGVPLRDSVLRSSIKEAITRLDFVLQRQFSDIPHATNRLRALTWRARGAALIGNFQIADDSYMAALDVAASDPKTMLLAARYAAEFDRQKFWDGLLDRADVEQNPQLVFAQASRRVLKGDIAAREDLRRLEAALPVGDVRRAQAISARLYLPFDPADTSEAVEHGLVELVRTKEPDSLVVGLALQLKEGKLTDELLQRIRDQLRAVDGSSFDVVTHLTTAEILNDGNEFELRNALQPARDTAVDIAGDDLPRNGALQAVRLALDELRLARGELLLNRYFPESNTDRLALRLRAALSFKKGDLAAAMGSMSRLVELKLANANEVLQWAWYARAFGQGLHARHLFRPDLVPSTETAREVSALANALQLLFRTRDYNRLLAEAGDRITDDEELFQAAVASTLSGRSAPTPDVVAVDTIAVLRRQDGRGEQRMVWITDIAGPSSPPFTRVQRAENWLTALIGRSLGSLVTFTSGVFAGEWMVEQILPGAAGTQARLLEWAVRQGIAGGGVDTINGNDDPIVSITQRMQEDRANRTPPPPDVPIAMIFHVRQCIPFKFLGDIERPRFFFGRSGELESEIAIFRRSPTDTYVYVDPLTILIAEQLGIAETLIKAAGRVRVMAQSQLTLIAWWWEEREHRHVRASAALGSDGRMIFQEHTPSVRAWGRKLWRAIAQRRQDSRVEIIRAFPDEMGKVLSGLNESLDLGTLATFAATAGTSNVYASIDGNLIDVTRRLKTLDIRAISLLGLLRWGVLRGRITWLEEARAIVQLSRGNWSFISVGSAEIAAVLAATDRKRRNADLSALLRDFSTSEPRGAVRVVTEALDRISGEPAAVRTRVVAEQLFDALPTIPRSVRAQLAPSYKGRWYSSVLRAWRKKGGAN